MNHKFIFEEIRIKQRNFQLLHSLVEAQYSRQRPCLHDGRGTLAGWLPKPAVRKRRAFT